MEEGDVPLSQLVPFVPSVFRNLLVGLRYIPVAGGIRLIGDILVEEGIPVAGGNLVVEGILAEDTLVVGDIPVAGGIPVVGGIPPVGGIPAVEDMGHSPHPVLCCTVVVLSFLQNRNNTYN